MLLQATLQGWMSMSDDPHTIKDKRGPMVCARQTENRWQVYHGAKVLGLPAAFLTVGIYIKAVLWAEMKVWKGCMSVCANVWEWSAYKLFRNLQLSTVYQERFSFR